MLLVVLDFFYELFIMDCRIDMSSWYICNYCKSDAYIMNIFPDTHWAYRVFKTCDKRFFDKHIHSIEHLKYFEKYYCDACMHQCYNKLEFEKHCDTIKHKTNSNITMECKLCEYTTSNKYSFEAHTYSKKHQNAIKGIEKKEFRCESCNFKTNHKSEMKRHEESKKHQDTRNGIVIQTEFVCEPCNFKTNHRSEMKRHEETKKHQNIVNNTQKEELVCEPCGYKTKYKSQMKIHEESKKHQNKLKPVEVVE